MMRRLSWNVYPVSPISQFLGCDWDQMVGKLIENTTNAAPGPESFHLRADVWEAGDKVHLEADLPGTDPENLDIQVTRDGLITLEVKKSNPALPEGAAWLRRERANFFGSRAIQLPFRVDPDSVDATLKNGILSLSLSKLVEQGPRKVQVKSV